MNTPGSTEYKKHPKQDFQVERLAFFSDAVFAIALTLLIIEFKVPEITKESTAASIIAQLNEMGPQLISLLFCFYMIAIYWMRHHFLFKHIHNYNREIIVVNMLLLLPIIFLPFTTSFLARTLLSRDNEVIILGLQLFMINHLFVSLFTYLLYYYATIRHKDLSFEMDTLEKNKFRIDTLFLACIFALALATSFITHNLKTILSLFLIWAIVKRMLDHYGNKRSFI